MTGNANRQLASLIASRLSLPLANSSVKKYADGETGVEIFDNLHRKRVYILQASAPPVNDSLMEILLLASTARRAGAEKVILIAPYYGYARQDRKGKANLATPVSAGDVAQLLETAGVDEVVSVDLHCVQIQGMFRKSLVNLEAQAGGVAYFKQKLTPEQLVVVAPDAGGVKRAKEFHKNLELASGKAGQVNFAIIEKQRAKANVIESMTLIGSVQDKDCVLVDDIIDTAGTMCQAAQLLRDSGARRVYAFATHGLFSGQAAERIRGSCFEEVVVTDSVVASKEFVQQTGGKVQQISLDLLLAETIRRLETGESLKDLYGALW